MNEFGWTGDLGVPACLGVAPLNAARRLSTSPVCYSQVTRAAVRNFTAEDFQPNDAENGI